MSTVSGPCSMMSSHFWLLRLQSVSAASSCLSLPSLCLSPFLCLKAESLELTLGILFSLGLQSENYCLVYFVHFLNCPSGKSCLLSVTWLVTDGSPVIIFYLPVRWTYRLKKKNLMKTKMNKNIQKSLFPFLNDN